VSEIYLTKEFYENTSLAIIIINKDLEVEKLNKAGEIMTGYMEKELIGKKIYIFRSHRYSKDFNQLTWEEVDKNGIWEGEAWNRHKAGNLYLVRRSVFKTKDEKGEIKYVLIARDITELKNKEEKIEKLYYRDILTELPNKHVFTEICDRLIKNSKRKRKKMAVCFINITRFHKINDSFGYGIGDETLKDVAKRLRSVIGEDTFMTRMGGDLFAFLISDAEEEKDIINIINKISVSFKKIPFFIKEQEVYLSISMGISIYPQDGLSSQELFTNADAARSRARENNADNYQFYKKELNVKMFEKIVMETNLRKAYENNEFVMYYQPQNNIKTNEIESVEALIRWSHPEIGIIPPSKFIPLAEEIGLILNLGDWALYTACMQNKKWQDKGFKKIPVAVNVSTVQFAQFDFVKKVKDVLAISGLEPKYLELEITESSIMKDIQKTIEILKELNEIGVKISIDDFGTGYSSLSYLAKFPIHSLKIDRSFMENIPISKENKTIVSLIIKMAHELNLDVIAEGIEEEAQLEFLKSENCEKYQGYYFSHPLPAKKIEKYIKL
jgi:diguanylate cyclase (GGDEF)-like protein/PAS domain S-box-containing protein